MRLLCAGMLLLSSYLGAHATLEEALTHSDQVIVDQPDNAKVYLERADHYLGHGEVEKAQADALKAIALGLAPEEAALVLAQCSLKLKQWKKAQEYADVALDLDDEDWRAWNILGQAQLALGDFTQAAFSFSHARLFSDENSPALLQAQALALHAGGESESALSLLDEELAKGMDAAVLSQSAFEIEKETSQWEAALKRAGGLASRSASGERIKWRLEESALLLSLNRPKLAIVALADAAALMESMPSSRKNLPVWTTLYEKIKNQQKILGLKSR